MSKRIARAEYVPSVEVFAMSRGFGIEWTGTRGYAGQVQYRSSDEVIQALRKWMDEREAQSQETRGDS